MAHIVYTDMTGQECTVPIGAQTPVVSIGRAVDCTIRSNRKSVSRHHAEFRFTNGQFEIIDLNSSNGTYLIINEQRRPVMGREYVTHTDEVWCGDFILRFFDEIPVQAPYEDRTVEGDENYRRPIQTMNELPPTNNYGNQNQSGFQNPGSSPPIPEQNWSENSSVASDPAPRLPNQSGFGNEVVNPPESWANELAPDSEWSNQNDYQPAQNTIEDSPELERLLAEKNSIEDMASRQRKEIERLEKIVKDLRVVESSEPPPPQDDGQMEMLARELSSRRLEVQDLKEQLDKERELAFRMEELEREIDELRLINDSLRRDLAGAQENAKNPEVEESLRNDIEAKVQVIVDLENELDMMRRDLNEEKRKSEAADAAEGEVEKLREEVKRKERLVVEFERRNRELQHDLSVHEQASSNLRSEIDRLKELTDDPSPGDDAERFQQELEQIRQALNESQTALVEKSREMEALAATLEEDDSGEKIAELETEIVALKEALAHNDVIEPTVASVAAPPEVREFLERLERLVDAIDRTDLGPLSTVDRVRLQSAIRDTDPKATLKSILDSL